MGKRTSTGDDYQNRLESSIKSLLKFVANEDHWRPGWPGALADDDATRVNFLAQCLETKQIAIPEVVLRRALMQCYRDKHRDIQERGKLVEKLVEENSEKRTTIAFDQLKMGQRRILVRFVLHQRHGKTPTGSSSVYMVPIPTKILERVSKNHREVSIYATCVERLPEPQPTPPRASSGTAVAEDVQAATSEETGAARSDCAARAAAPPSGATASPPPQRRRHSVAAAASPSASWLSAAAAADALCYFRQAGSDAVTGSGAFGATADAPRPATTSAQPAAEIIWPSRRLAEACQPAGSVLTDHRGAAAGDAAPATSEADVAVSPAPRVAKRARVVGGAADAQPPLVQQPQAHGQPQVQPHGQPQQQHVQAQPQGHPQVLAQVQQQQQQVQQPPAQQPLAQHPPAQHPEHGHEVRPSPVALHIDVLMNAIAWRGPCYPHLRLTSKPSCEVTFVVQGETAAAGSQRDDDVIRAWMHDKATLEREAAEAEHRRASLLASIQLVESRQKQLFLEFSRMRAEAAELKTKRAQFKEQVEQVGGELAAKRARLQEYQRTSQALVSVLQLPQLAEGGVADARAVPDS